MIQKTAVMIALLSVSALPLAVNAIDHGAMKMDHGSHQGNVAHEEVVDGVKATYKVENMKERLKALKIEMPKGMKETHHISVELKDAKTGKPITEGEVKAKVQGPDKGEQTKDLMAMQGHFGNDFDLSKPGKYGVMTKFKVKDGKVRNARFWYTVK